MKNLILGFTILFIIMGIQTFAQSYEKFYDHNWKECQPSDARFYSIVTKTDSGWLRKDYFATLKSLQMSGLYEDETCKIENGEFRYYYGNRNPEFIGKYVHKKKEGQWLSYHYNGMMNDSSFYVNGKRVGTSIGWYPNGYIYDSLILDKNGKGVIYGWFDNGNPGYVGKYSEGEKKDGIWKYFHKNGKLSSLETYKDGKIIDRKYYNEEGGEVKDTTTKEIESSFTGGKEGWMKYLVKNLKYPSKYTIKNTNRASVTVTFTVNEDGKVENVFPSTPFYPEFDNSAMEVIKNSPDWIPAFYKNRHVKYTMRQTITFNQEL